MTGLDKSQGGSQDSSHPAHEKGTAVVLCCMEAHTEERAFSEGLCSLSLLLSGHDWVRDCSSCPSEYIY